MSEQISFETVDDTDEAIMNAASEIFGAIQRKSIWDDRLRLTKSQLVAKAIEWVEESPAIGATSTMRTFSGVGSLMFASPLTSARSTAR